MNRYGFSRITGVVATVVYGGLGKLCAGAPCTPTNTLFQTAFWLLPMFESRVNHCCWENGCTAPTIRLSAMYPPEAKPKPVGARLRSPRMSTRRIGAACATAHRAEPGTMKFSADRQKFW